MSNCNMEAIIRSPSSSKSYMHLSSRFMVLTIVGSSPKKNGLSASMSDRTLRSFWPNSMISSGLCTPIPCAFTFLAPCKWFKCISEIRWKSQHTKLYIPSAALLNTLYTVTWKGDISLSGHVRIACSPLTFHISPQKSSMHGGHDNEIIPPLCLLFYSPLAPSGLCKLPEHTYC